MVRNRAPTAFSWSVFSTHRGPLMFSSGIMQWGRYSLSSHPTSSRRNGAGLSQLATAVHRYIGDETADISVCCVASASSAGVCRRPGTPFGAAATVTLHDNISSSTGEGYGLRLQPEQGMAPPVERWELLLSQSARPPPRTSGFGGMVRVLGLEVGRGQRPILSPAASRAASASAVESRPAGVAATGARLGKRWLSTGPIYPGDEDTGGDDSDTDCSEFESTLFARVDAPAKGEVSKAGKVHKTRAAGTNESDRSSAAADAPETSVHAAAVAEGRSAAKNPKTRRSRNRRARKSEGKAPSSKVSDRAAEPAATRTAGTAPAAAAVAGEGGAVVLGAAARKKPRRPRNRCASNSEGTAPSPPAASGSAAEPAFEERETPAAVAAAGGGVAAANSKPPKARKSRKRWPMTKSKTTTTIKPSLAAELAVLAEETAAAQGTPTAAGGERGVGAGGEAQSGVKIPESRRTAFQRARRAGVARRAEEGGGGALDKGQGSGGDDDSEDGHKRGPTTWQAPAKIVNPLGFVAAEGSPEADKQRRQRRRQHPVLGHFVADLGYKRVYVTSVEALLKAPVWQKARTLRHVHAVEIFRAKKLEAEKLEIRKIVSGEVEAKGELEIETVKGMPGVITLFQRPLLPLRKKNQKYILGIVDGQHRVGALSLLAEEGLWDKSAQNVVVEVFDTKDEKAVEELFVEINRAEPSVVDFAQPGPEEIKKCADKVVLHLYYEYRPMFGGERVRPPSLNATIFKENMLSSGMIERHELYDPDLLLDYLLRVNEMLSQREASMWELMIGHKDAVYSNKRSLATALKKAKRHNFWLGMELSWMLV